MKSDLFDTVVRETLEKLPEQFREALDNIEILVVDAPDDDLDLDSKNLLGLYTGTPLPERDSDYSGELPDVIYVFRNPHLALGLPPDELRDEIATTLTHEIAHYFGLDDERLDELGWS